ncbi:MAG: hypothetical protein VKL20_05825, partial [Synechocystis sp.]|nr:hypothetical protein [Synechocystis sp.]
IDVTKWKHYVPSLDAEICLEYWQLSNPQDILQEKKEILELSVKVECDGAQKMWENFNQFLEKHSIDPMGKQAPKTRTALDYFAGSVQSSSFQ